MGFVSFLPENEFLEKFIAYYYCDGSDDPSYRNSYLFYPHVNTTISLYKNASREFDGGHSVISNDKNNKYLKIVTQQSLPNRVTQIGKTRKIAIVFKPLGLNSFIKEKYFDLVQNEVQTFSPSNNAEWDEMLDELFCQHETPQIAKILNTFLLRQYNGFENTVLNKAISMLLDIDNDSSIEEIAKAFNISRKTLLRHFKSEMRISPELFRTISRFRYTLNEKILKESSDTLTQLAYKANFFDQSYFIKRFKQLTGATPRQFFKQGVRIGSEDTFWTFVNNFQG